jgi:predicted nucleotidyltransferase
MGFLECIRARIEGVDELSERIYSLILFGSYVRGDFVEDISDLDFFAVVIESHERIIERLRSLLDECTKNIKRREVDLAWSYLKELDDPLNKGYPFNFLTIYQDDFLGNHIVVYGEGIDSILPRYDWRELIRWRAERLLKNLERDRGNPKMLRIGAGQVIRLLALMNGARGIGKDDILSTVEILGDPEALEIFKAYLEGITLERENGFWVGFITSRINKIF